MNISNNILEKDISTLFGFEDMTDDEKKELLDSIGSAIMESAVLRYITSVNEESTASFEKFIEEHGDEENIFEQLLVTFPDFEIFLGEEVSAFKLEAEEVLKA